MKAERIQEFESLPDVESQVPLKGEGKHSGFRKTHAMGAIEVKNNAPIADILYSVLEGRSISEAAKKLDLSRYSIRRWSRLVGIDFKRLTRGAT